MTTGRLKDRPYQSKGIAKCIRNWSLFQSGKNDALASNVLGLATGLGKTHIISRLVEELFKRGMARHILIVAHRGELVEGARDKVASQCPDRMVGLYMAEHRQLAEVTAASIGSCHDGRIDEILEYDFDVMILDEMHHITEDNQWGRLLAALRERNPKLLFAGFTATPQRTDKNPFGWLFQDVDCVCGHMTMFDGIKEGWLCPIKVLRVDLEVEGANLKRDKAGRIDKSEIINALDTDDGKAKVIAKWRELASGRKYPDGRLTIAFCPNVDSAIAWADAFNKAGIPSGWVADTSRLSKDVRRQVLDNLGSGKLRVVFNVDVLTEGFDEPMVSCVMFLRGTSSSVLLTQAIGRGLRIKGYDIDESIKNGKSDCLVLDFVGATKAGIVTGVDLSDAKPEIEGEELLDELPTEKGITPIDIHEIKSRVISGHKTFEVDLSPGGEVRQVDGGTVVAPFRVDTVSGAVSWIRVGGARVAPIGHYESLVVLPLDGAFACVYARPGHGCAIERCDDLDDALRFGERNILTAQVSEWARPDAAQMMTAAGYAELTRIDELSKQLEYNPGLESPPSVSYAKAITAYMEAVIELRNSGYEVKV